MEHELGFPPGLSPQRQPQFLSIFCASARGRLPSPRGMEFQGAEGGPIGRGLQDQCDWGSNLE